MITRSIRARFLRLRLDRFRAASATCRSETFEDANYTVCSFDLTKADLRMFWGNAEGAPYRTFATLAEALGGEGRTLAFAMNGGMYGDDFPPIGLYIENGKELSPANTETVTGEPAQIPNFYKKPNGVFYLGDDEAGVLETERFLNVAAGGELRHAVRADAGHRRRDPSGLHRQFDRPQAAQRRRRVEPDRGAFRHHRGPREFPRFRALLPRRARLRQRALSRRRLRARHSMRRNSAATMRPATAATARSSAWWSSRRGLGSSLSLPEVATCAERRAARSERNRRTRASGSRAPQASADICAERLVVGEGAQQLEVALAGSCTPERIASTTRISVSRADAAGGDAVAGVNAPVRIRRRFERAHDGRADRDDAPAARARARRRRSPSPRGMRIGLVEGQPRVERRVAGRGDAGGVGERGEADAARAPAPQRAPVEREAGRRRLEGDRAGGDARPDVPERQRLGDMRVLDRPSVPRDARPDRVRRCRRSEARRGADGRAMRSTIATSGPSVRAVARRERAAEAGGPRCACDSRRRRRRRR